MKLSTDETKILNYFQKKNLVKKGYFIFAEKKEFPLDTRINKFGGLVPVPKNSKAIPKCKTCKKDMEVLAQIYVPKLPKDIVNNLPEDLKETLIVLYLCPEDLPIESQSNIIYNIYKFDEIPNLIYVKNNKSKNKIMSSIFNEIKIFDTFADTLNEYLNQEDKEVDQVQVEQFMEKVRREYRKSKCYFLGYPFYNQSEVNPGDDYQLFLNLEDDENFSFMFGDAGSAQIWVKKKDEKNRFLLTWQCG